MSGLLLTLKEFRTRALTDTALLASELAAETGRAGEDERHAWMQSLPKLAKAFGSPSMAPLHVYFDGRGRTALEYPLPSAPHWCDMVLLGATESAPSAVVIELKNWITRADTPGIREGLIGRQGRQELHPSDQVRGYAEYCRRFHSAVSEFDAGVHGCVVLTGDRFYSSYVSPPNEKLVGQFPLFSLDGADLDSRFPEFLRTRVDRPHEEFAQAFVRGIYRQDRGFMRSVAAQFADPAGSPLELLDGQRRALALCQASVDAALFGPEQPSKTVIVVEGPPGSGKSVVAARLWGATVSDERLPDGNVTFVTTSTAQASNWRHIYASAANDVAARGAVLTANSYVPFTTNDVGRALREFAGLIGPVDEWRKNLAEMENAFPEQRRTQVDQFLVSMVDEAHALVNPEHADGRGQFGFAVNLGPQAYHVIRSSVVSVFFLDSRQSFREHESTSIDDLRAWASELGAELVGPISLAGAQYRCGGSQLFMDAVDRLTGVPDLSAAAETRGVYETNAAASFDTRVFRRLGELEEWLRAARRGGESVRFVASYGRPWRSQRATEPRKLPEQARDFVVEEAGGSHWAKVWNVVPGSDYTRFVAAPDGTPMAEDPLAEVGCPYVVRGFDFDRIGLIWLSDVVWRRDRWMVNLEHVHETGLRRHVQRAKAEESPNGPHHRALLEHLLRGYRILLTRAMRGIGFWFEDDETARHVSVALLSGDSGGDAARVTTCGPGGRST